MQRCCSAIRPLSFNESVREAGTSVNFSSLCSPILVLRKPPSNLGDLTMVSANLHQVSVPFHVLTMVSANFHQVSVPFHQVPVSLWSMSTSI